MLLGFYQNGSKILDEISSIYPYTDQNRTELYLSITSQTTEVAYLNGLR